MARHHSTRRTVFAASRTCSAALARSPEAGGTTAIALLALSAVTVIGLALLDLSVREVQVATNLAQATQSLYAAEAGVEQAYQQIKALTRLGDVNAAAATSIDPPSSTFPNYTFSTFTVQPLFVLSGTPTPISQIQPVTTGPYQGLNAIAQNYLVTSEVTAPNQSRARIVQAVQAGLVGVFQFAVFYDQVLEIFPGQPMTLLGRVHSNSAAYVGNGTRIDSYLTAAGSIFNYRYDNNRPCTVGTCSGPGGGLTGFAQIKNAVGAYVPLDHDSRSTAPPWASWALGTYAGLVRDAALQATALNLPINLAGGETPHQIIERGSGNDSATLQQQKLYWQADYRILVNADGSVTVKTGPFGAESVAPLDTSSFLRTDKKFADGRERKCIDVAQIDLGALRTAPGFSFSNGVLYVSSSHVTSSPCGSYGTHMPAVRLTNGAQLPASTQGGFTVVSDGPIYIQGNYNTVNKVAAAVMGDAITILSNNWGPNNSDSKGDLPASGNRPATATTINAAMIAGNVPTIPGTRYSGGLENYLRLLEAWSGVTLTYTGSLVTLWQSQTATAAWGGSYYTVPIRNWSFDTLFNTTLPPGTPRVHVAQRLGWWHQE
jgi:hypothetical protein